jgi:hypothetical protein
MFHQEINNAEIRKKYYIYYCFDYLWRKDDFKEKNIMSAIENSMGAVTSGLFFFGKSKSSLKFHRIFTLDEANIDKY